MPIRPDLRHLYRGPEWAELRRKVLERAGGRCEMCGKPAGRICYTFTWQSWTIEPGLKLKHYYMAWVASNGTRWRDQNGRKFPPFWWLPGRGLPRRVFVLLTVAHADNDAANMAEENLRAWCTWCHLHHDQQHHKLSRSRRKDAGRPILQELSKHAT